MKQVCVAWLLLLCVTGAAGACSTACTLPQVCDSDNTCKVGADADCTSGGDACVAHSTCTGSAGTSSSATCVCEANYANDASLCKAEPGQACDDTAIFCTAKHTCDNEKCKANIGQNCDEDATPPVNCLTDHTCATTCKGNAGQSCDLDASPREECVGTATCEGGTCKAKAGETCDGSTVTCVAGHTCDGGKCKANIGQTCNTQSTPPVNCLADHTCETTCKANAGQSCDLSANPQEECVGTAACEGGTCRIKDGQSCANNPNDCVSAAACTSNTCSCNTTISTLDSGTKTCTPKDNKVGGTCTKTTGTDSCVAEDANSRCSDSNKCECPGPVFQTKASDLTCEVAFDQDCSGDKSTLCTSTTVCTSNKCKRKVDESCATNDDCAGSNVECTSLVCTCKAGKSANSDKSDCSGVAALAGSVLLLIAALVMSRFL